MKKILILLSLLFIPIIIVNAETLTYNVCASGCEYNQLNDVYTAIYALPKTSKYDIVINIKDGREYTISSGNCRENWGNEFSKSTIKIIGTDETPTIIGENDTIRSNIVTAVVYYKNIKLKNNSWIEFSNHEGDSKVTLDNVYMEAEYINMRMKNAEINNTTFIGDIIRIEGDYEHINNSTFKDRTSGGHHSVEIASDFLIENSTFTDLYINNTEVINNSKGTFRNDTINGNIYNGKQMNIENSTINGTFTSANSHFSLKNVTVNTDGTYAISIQKNNCSNVTESSTKEAEINNLTIKGNPAIGIFANSIDSTYKMNINNSDLTDATCSIILDVPDNEPCSDSANINRIYPTFLAQNYKNLNAHIKTSKVNCARVQSHNSSYNAGNMYFEGSNTWTVPISRGTNLETNNVTELNKGNIYIDFANKDILKLNVDLSKPIIDYFKDIIPEGKVLGEWRIEDPSILKVVDGKIVPLKVGVTRLVATIDNNNYVLEIEVTEDMLPKEEVNPKTGAFASYIIFVVLVMIAIIIINQKNKRLYKIK